MGDIYLLLTRVGPGNPGQQPTQTRTCSLPGPAADGRMLVWILALMLSSNDPSGARGN